MTRTTSLLALLLISAAIVCLSSLAAGAAVAYRAGPEPGRPPAAKAESEESFKYMPFGLYGDITADVLVDRLNDNGEQLAFVGTSNGLYVVGLDGKLRHFLYTPFGVRFVALITDITGDGSREVAVALNDVQVPALRCYDGATWEKLWQFAPAVRVWDRRWVKVQLSVADMEILDGIGLQSLVVAAGRCVFSVDARNGASEWEFRAPHALEKLAAIPDVNGDKVDELLAGSEAGELHLINGRTGGVAWQTRLPEYEDDNGSLVKAKVNDILVLDREAGKVVVTSGDGFARMFDLNNQSLRWETEVFGDQGMTGRLRAASVSEGAGDSPARVVVVEGSDYITYTTSGCQVAVLDANGTLAWKKTLPMWGYYAPEIGLFNGKPVILASTEQQIELINAADAESVAKTIPIENLDKKAAIVAQLEEDRYLLVSSLGDMCMVSASGERLWCFPRISHITTESGDFVGDDGVDTLFCCEWDFSVQGTTYSIEPGRGISIDSSSQRGLEVRSLQMMDGTTRTVAWTYEIGPAELLAVGGLKGMQLTPDLVGGDGVPDFIGYSENNVFIFSGRDGNPAILPIRQTVTSVGVLRNGDSGWAVAVGVADPSGDDSYPHEYALLTIDGTGTELWGTTYTEWIQDETYSHCRGFTVLDDINGDKVSDLALAYTSHVAIFGSIDGPDNYGLLRNILAQDGWTIGALEIVPDSNGDGVRELAYFQDGKFTQQGGTFTQPCPLLCLQSLSDGQSLFKVDLDGQVMAYDLACGDFDADGCADSVLLLLLNLCGAAGSRKSNQLGLQAVSGRTGTVLWSHTYDMEGYRWGSSGIPDNPLPAVVVGDLSGDSADDLALARVAGHWDYSDDSLLQSRLEVFSPAGNDRIDVIPTSAAIRRSEWQYAEQDETALRFDVGRDGRQEVIAWSIEPEVPYQPESANPFASMEARTGHSDVLAVANTADARHMGSFTGFAAPTVSLFHTNQADCLGLAARGCAYFLSLNSGLEVTSPSPGAKTGSIVGVRWEGNSQGEFVQVFVDGVRNYSGSASSVDLQLSRGRHEIVVRSVDDCGRISYGPSDLGAPLTITVTSSPWKPVLLLLSLFVLLAFTMLLFYARLHRTWRARRRAARA
ncbi:MAG: PQQ-binding-like beta-propeller repeat protein [Dehalococcoidia bacterium]|nr:PQQ-binding-like beta-propeller repeat protein [Dehalococcoidia bacterium]